MKLFLDVFNIILIGEIANLFIKVTKKTHLIEADDEMYFWLHKK